MTAGSCGRLLTLGVVMAAVAVACGGEPDQPPTDPTTTPPPTATSAATPTAPPETTPTASPPATPTPVATPTPIATTAPAPTSSPTAIPSTATASPSPTASEPEPTTLRYDTYDLTGAVEAPGSYAFLMDARDVTSVTGDFSEFGEAAALLVNISDSGGTSHAALYNSLEVGDIVEWYPIAYPDCWERHRVTAILPDPRGEPPRKLFAVEALPVEIDECLERSVGEETLKVELRWNPPGAHQGPTGPPTMLQGQPVEGGATYRVAPHASLRIDVPEGMTLVRYTGGIVAAWNPPVGLRDVRSGSVLVLGLHTGEELERRMSTAPSDPRDVGGLFDQIVASARTIEPTTLRYDTYDLTGAVEAAGSYAFLADADDTTSVVTTYEGLRDGTATALLIHTTDADGVSRADVYDAVEVGDLFEWRQADDCWVRYTVTLLPTAASGTAARTFEVRAFTDSYAGCNGTILAEVVRSISWAPPAISSRALTAPVRHGAYHLIPAGWTGPVADSAIAPVPDDIAAVRDHRGSPHPFWRPATVPEGWSLAGVTWGGETDPPYGYSAWYQNEHGETGVEILVGYWGGEQYPYPLLVFRDTDWEREPRIIDGHHALVEYSPLGPNHEPQRLPRVYLFDEQTRMGYIVIAWDPRLAGADPTATIEIARSLIEQPPAAGE